MMIWTFLPKIEKLSQLVFNGLRSNMYQRIFLLFFLFLKCFCSRPRVYQIVHSEVYKFVWYRGVHLGGFRLPVRYIANDVTSGDLSHLCRPHHGANAINDVIYSHWRHLQVTGKHDAYPNNANCHKG